MFMPDISDQASEKTIALSIKAVKLDAKLLAKAIQALLKRGNRLVTKMTTSKDINVKGKQTVKQLVRQGQGVSNIEITNKNIKSFESVARKYGVDFALKKDKTSNPPKWLVFFKAKDADALTAAFKEFTAKVVKRRSKPSLTETLDNMDKKAKSQVTDKEKNKSHGGHEL
jgi:hypothetical protein